MPFIKIDKGLEAEAKGVQLMKPMPELDALLSRARGLGVFGTKERSVINLANREGIAAVVRQQFDVARQVLAAGLVPIIEPEVNIKSPERRGRPILLEELLEALDALPGDDKVMLKLSSRRGRPVRAAGRSSARAARGRAVGRLFAPRGLPRAREESRHDRELLARPARGSAPPDERREFDRSLGEAIDEIYQASTEKVAA